MTQVDVGHIRFTLSNDGTFNLTAPEGDSPKKKLFTGFTSLEMANELRTLAKAIESGVKV